ncbi:type II toxin-antitoxin system RelE/ParE family toxin [Mesorhizobium sp. ESP-6-4]|uniref:type II toxin-antitoxin system RelE/ParE family toxin n=1 Tax=unclassified Mesorhizobium TaxID=325217 RepID=UPI001125C2F5|nr:MULTISPECIES: type II toxin-antitoxin system RelE/ParE family toxin [unclassified Mesorhizobium]MBZ9657883.1 type II toxin-antitoxin system RelE/ParE family toxin [Mesorhizobium sp. ESP-6-4]MBZ9812949.1 type II toxin-antitoxin system RelE/ParE family toxin [Mesorhizobium sp. CA7]MBZ9843053.1 type II toxin-antitoxin system RelE/ParE family toxin [Mesorhizobium sp. CA5]MBZ9858091.1 type II toxin-antitoxin system RelE/ParE family toxin [Mesorhizobium sp. CA12]MBZ9867282.1 type II toxin-antitox
MKYCLLPQALVDLETIGDYIAARNPNAAVRFVEALQRRWDLLTLHPQSGAPRDDILPGIRHLVVGEYLTFYRIGNDAIEILRVLHGRRKIEADDLI